MKEIKNFWYITSIDNLESIFEYGILCRSRINDEEISATDISDSGVQRHREKFHDFVPLFFADNTPMFYNVFNENYENVCLLEIDKEVKVVEGVQFSNGNIASQNTEIYDSLEEFTNEEWEIIFSRNPSYGKEWKRIRSAEILVPDKVPVKYITSISVDEDSTNLYNQAFLSVMIAKLDIPVNKNLTLSGIC